MKIDSVNISDFGLSVLTGKDYLDFPARKPILEEPEFTENDIKLKSSDFTIELYGKWYTLTGLQTSLNGLQLQIMTSVKHTIEIPEYNIPEIDEVVFKNGYSVDFLESNGVMMAKITIKVTVTNLIGRLE